MKYFTTERSCFKFAEIGVSSQAEESMKSFSLRCSRNTEKFPDEDIRVPE